MIIFYNFKKKCKKSRKPTVHIITRKKHMKMFVSRLRNIADAVGFPSLIHVQRSSGGGAKAVNWLLAIWSAVESSGGTIKSAG